MVDKCIALLQVAVQIAGSLFFCRLLMVIGAATLVDFVLVSRINANRQTPLDA